MHKVQELTSEQLAMDYDFNEVLSLCQKAKTIFPANSQIRTMLETIMQIHDDAHIYLSAEQGTKAEQFIKELLCNKKINDIYDWCYIYNFDDPNQPQLVKLEKGRGLEFKESIESSVKNAINEIIEYFSGKEMKQIEKAIKNEIIERSEKLLTNLKIAAKQMSFSTHVSEKGIFFIPIINGKKISEAEYDSLNAEEQEIIINDLNKIEKTSKSIMKKIKKIKKESKSRIRTLKKKVIEELLLQSFEQVVKCFNKYDDIKDYIQKIEKSLEDNLCKILLDVEREELQKISKVVDLDDAYLENQNKYTVNLVVKSEKEEVPIIYAQKVTYYELFGKIEYISDSSNYTTNFTLIQPGLTHLANGGYLILDILDLISNKLIWDKLKKTLVEKEISYDNIREQFGALPIKTIDPEKMPLDLKVVLIGEEHIYQALYEIDPQFKDIFSYHLLLQSNVDVNNENVSEYIAYLQKEDITDTALKRLVEYGIKLTGNRNKMTTRLTELEKLINISRSFAQEEGSAVIEDYHIIKGENELKKYNNHYEKTLMELIIKGQLLFEVTGKKKGQINALSVSSYVDHQIAYPIRITAITYAGEEGIISIEKENKLSGKIFGKGLSIISSYMNSIFAKEQPLSVNCLLCLEQVYGDIEGDSASCAEVYALLSVLSQIPIDQGIGITGSLDQLGNVQPIGCVSEKIEGFYNACKLKGLTGNQGVIVPNKNVNEIILNDEILASIKENNFHIYPITRIEEGVPLLMNTSFEKVKKTILNTSRFK